MEVYNDSIIIDVSGVGYQVFMSHPEVFSPRQSALVYISHIVREDEQYFVGFSSLKEKDVFNKLINCKGIGPRTALGALRDITLDEFLVAIQTSDVKRLKKLSGIGPKAASQIILDLKGSLSDFGVISSKTTKKTMNKNQEEAMQGLKVLGFKVKEIEECFERINDDSLTTEEYIRTGLRMLRK